MYHLNLFVSMPSELILSLYSYQCQKAHRIIDLGPEWVKQTCSTLNPDFQAELKEAGMNGDWDNILLTAYAYTKQYPNAQPEEFVNWLENIRTGDLYETLSPYTNTFPMNLDEERQHFAHILSKWHQEYFSKHNNQMRNLLQSERTNRGDVQFVPNPPQTAETITNGLYFEPTDDLQEVVLVPQYHYRPSNLMLSYRQITLCHYPIKVQEKNDDAPPAQLSLMAKSLSVESRLRILKYLRNGPKKFTDIANYIGLAKGVTHDHLFNLRRSGFVRTHVLGSSASMYSLRECSVERLTAELQRWLK